MNILYISLFPLTPNNPAAGGQIAYYFTNKIKKDSNNRLKVLCSVPPQDQKFVEESKKEFDAYYFNEPTKNFLTKICSKLNFSKGGMDPRTVRMFINGAKSIRKDFDADYIIFDWETPAYLINEIKDLWPQAETTVIEQDVTSQSYERFFLSQTNPLKKMYWRILYKNCLKLEKKVFSKVDHIGVLTQKDANLVEKIFPSEKTSIVAPYYYNYNNFVLNKEKTNDILFFGYMKRTENIEAVQWFIKTVLPAIKNCRFVILGGGVSEDIKKLESQNIHITGFQSNEELTEWFKNSLCMIVPLKHGAGVKIKVLESLSAGLPVLTNEIGIEGIPANNKEHFLFCKNETDYVEAIKWLLEDSSRAIEIGSKARKLMKENFDYESSSYIIK